jgi:hypothetical protein
MGKKTDTKRERDKKAEIQREREREIKRQRDKKTEIQNDRDTYKIKHFQEKDAERWKNEEIDMQRDE